MSDGNPTKKRLGASDPSAAGAAIDPDRDVRVLIAEDNAYMRDHLRGMLEQDGMTVVGEAADGLEAVAMFKQLQPDAVVMDLVMPNLDGIGAITQIMGIDDDARIVVCSGLGSDAEVANAIAARALDFLVKPFQVERVAKVIRSVLPGVVPLTGRSEAFD